MVATRRAGTDDTPLLVALMAEFYAESEFSLDREWASKSFSALLGDDAKGAVWIAFRDDEPAGYAVLTLRHSMEYGGPDGFIDDLYVRPSYRRQGLGREALRALFAECERRGVLAVHVEAGRDNVAAQRLYRSFGLDVLDKARELLTVRLRAASKADYVHKECRMSESVHNGGCACGKVKVEARGEPYRVGVCHCLTCRKLHGMPFSFYAVFPPEAVTIEGEVGTFASSEHGRRYFCPACGSQVYSHYSRADELYVYPGSFDETGLWQPTYELWTIRREPWLPAFPSVVSHYETDRPKWSRMEP